MPVLYSVLMTIQVLSAISIVILVLLQQGKGADMGAAFGSGSAGSVFGAAGSANFLSRTTAVAATIFFLTTLALAYTNKGPNIEKSDPVGIMETIPEGIQEDDSIVIPEEESDSKTGSGASKIPD
ncbi:preprotein translocase subunit SecG [Betaproteobacteria bacterium]|nr:preprotein translocase subunit SecG [Betaproteobacteria bacterium]